MQTKTVLITGAANGIGRAIAELLSRKGLFVIATDIDNERLKQLEALNNVLTITMDVTSVDSIKMALNELKENGINQLDVIINNAGIFTAGPLIEIGDNDFEKILKVNVVGTFLVSKYFFPFLLPRKGKIINMSSEAGRFSFPFNGPYSISKFAIEALSDALRRELSSLGIKVVKIQPGAVKTHLLKEGEEIFSKHIKTSEFFAKPMRLALKALIKDVEHGTSPEYIAKKVYKIIVKKNPKPTYRLKNNNLRRILEWLPERLCDLLINLAMW